MKKSYDLEDEELSYGMRESTSEEKRERREVGWEVEETEG